jgi:hypothetical protein
MYRYPKNRHPKLNCCQRHILLDAAQLDIHRLMYCEGCDTEVYPDDNCDDVFAILAYMWDNFDQCLVHARTIAPGGTSRVVVTRAYPNKDHMYQSAKVLYSIAECSQFETNNSSIFMNKWLRRYRELIDISQCGKCTPVHIMCCELRVAVQPPSLEQYLYLKMEPDHYSAHIYLPLPNQAWAMYVRDHIMDNMVHVTEPILPADSSHKDFMDDAYVKQMHSILSPGYRATPLKARHRVRVSMAAMVQYNHPLCFEFDGYYIKRHFKALYWDNFSLEFSHPDKDCLQRNIMYQVQKMLDKSDLQVVLPGTEDNLHFGLISQYMQYPALSKLSLQLGGRYSKTNLGIIGHGMAKVLQRLLSDPYMVQAIKESFDIYTETHQRWVHGFPQSVMAIHSRLVRQQTGLSDYAWHISEYLVHGLHEYEHLDDQQTRGHIIWEQYSWNYVPLLRAATALSEQPCLLLWYYFESTHSHSLNQSINNSHLSLATQDTEMIAIEMNMAGVSSTYFLQLYLDYLGKYALEIFAAVHIRHVHRFWWKKVAGLNRNSVASPPDCSCSPVHPGQDEEDYDDVEYSDMLEPTETLEIAE